MHTYHSTEEEEVSTVVERVKLEEGEAGQGGGGRKRGVVTAEALFRSVPGVALGACSPRVDCSGSTSSDSERTTYQTNAAAS